MDINIGIPAEDRKAIADGLSRLLADSYTLYLKTHNFHWNVKGPMFQTLHLLFETQYTELALAVDLVAERIRALDYPAPGTYAEFAKLSSIPEPKGEPKATAMIRELVEGQEAVVRTARSIFPLVDKVGDEPTADLLTQRMQTPREECLDAPEPARRLIRRRRVQELRNNPTGRILILDFFGKLLTRALRTRGDDHGLHCQVL